VIGVQELPPLGLAIDHRRARALRSPTRVARDGDQAEGLERRALALDRQRGDRLGVHRVAHKAKGVAAEHDVARTGGLLEARGDVHGVARGEGAAGRGRARDGLAGVDPDAHREVEIALPAQLTAQSRDLLAHLRGRSHRAQRVVLVRDRDAEDRHDGVADVVLDRPAVALDHDAHAPEPPLHRPAQRLGIHAFAQRRRPDDIGEHHRDDLAPLNGDAIRRHRRSARGAEPGSHRHPLAAAGARLHGQSLESLPERWVTTLRSRA